MKKILKNFLFSALAMVMLLAVFGVGIKKSEGNQDIANAANDKYVVSTDYLTERFRVTELKFVYDGIQVEYRYQDVYQTDDWVYRLVSPTGVVSSITNGSSYALIDGNITTYYFDEDSASTLEENFKLFNSIYSLPFEDALDNVFPVDQNTKVSFVVNAKQSSTFQNSYFHKIAYKTGLDNITFDIVSPEVQTDGTITLDGTYNGDSGLYEKTVNGRPFAYNFDPDTGFRLELGVVSSGIDLLFNAANKAYPIVITGPASTDESMDVDYTEYISYSSLAQADFKPKSGKIIKQIDLYLGKQEEENKLFTLYGGMSDEHTDGEGKTVVDYYFNDDFTLDTATIPIAVYGNYALAIDFHVESSYSYVFKEPSKTGGSYSQLIIEGKNLSDKESYVVNLYQNGKVRVYTYKATKGLIFDVTTQSYVQVNLKFVNNGTQVKDADASAKALTTLIVGGTTYQNSTEVDGPKIPRTVFVMGHSGSVEVQTTIDINNYRYHEEMGTDKIEGAVFSTTIESGVLNIYTEEKSTYLLEIQLLKPGGGYYRDSTTEIYVTTADSFDGVDPDTCSTDGFAIIRSLTEEMTVKFKIKISPYRMIEDQDGNFYTLEYECSGLVVTQNTTLVFTIHNFEIEKPVYCEGVEIGNVKIKLTSYSFGNAEYQVLFKIKDGEYEPITNVHPSRYGYDFYNLRMMGAGAPKDLLDQYIENIYIIGINDYDLHNYLASVVFGAEDKEEDGWIEAIYSPKLVSVRIIYPAQTIYTGQIYFDSNELYLDRKLVVTEDGKYFAGLKYTLADETTGAVYRNQTDYPELITEGFFEGKYCYELTNNWLCAENLVPIEVLTDWATFELSVVFTHSDGSTDEITTSITYSDEFSIEALNESYSYELPTYPGAGTFNHIGWAVEETDDYIEANSCDLILGRKITYLWAKNVRLVPVFSANIIVVSLYKQTDIGTEFVYSTTVSAGEAVDVRKLLFVDDNWIVPTRYGYVFEGFACSGNLAFDYVADPTYYVAVEDGNSGIFVNNGVLRWRASTNLVFETVYTDVEFKVLMDVGNQKYANPSEWTSNFGSWIEFTSDQFLLGGFGIDDTLILDGFAPKNEDAYIALVKFGYADSETTEFLDPEFVAVCDANGFVTGTNNGTRFNPEGFSISLVVNEFINAETGANTIKIYIEYLPVTYIISFTANILDEDENVVFEDSAETIYYKFTKENASISKADYWQACDETGDIILGIGWKDVMTPSSGLVFTKNSLGGISGIRYNAPGGKSYSFKFWKDINNGTILNSSSVLTANYNFTSIFSDVFDVTVNYYTYNSIGSVYEINSVEGYFASYHSDGAGGTELSIGETKTVNSYEIYLINGNLYYISAWSMVEPEGFNTTIGAGDKGLSENYSVQYSIDPKIINFYAVYSEYRFSVVEQAGATYKATATVSLPNDPNGNSYSSADVKFVKVLKTYFNSADYAKFSTVDKLNAILSDGNSVVNSTIAEGNVLEAPDVESNYYVFAVIQRKVDGMNILAFYVAMQLSINKD